MKKIGLLLIVLFLFGGCFHKSVKTGEADDIEKVIVYTGKEGSLLITVEDVFQASSKKSGGGITHISGHNDQRITSYDLSTGKILAREGTGEQIKNNIVLLGFSEGNIWFYSKDEDLGLHSRDPKTLAVKITQEKFFEANPTLKGNLGQSEWYQITDFYSFDPINKRVFLADNQGVYYAVNTTTLKAEKLPLSFKMPNDFFRKENGISRGLFNGADLDISGEKRKHIEVNNKEVNGNLSFLDGKLMADFNINSLYKRISVLHDLELKKRAIDSLKFDSAKAANKSHSWIYDRPFSDNYRFATKTSESFKEITVNCNLPREEYLLMPDSNTFFIMHKTSTAKDARLIISKMNLTNKASLKEEWQTKLDDIFFDADAAETTDSFKKVFSKGSPKFDFKYYDLVGDKLIIIHMLNAVCLDVKTGKVLWKFSF
jgi:hypothetical protein